MLGFPFAVGGSRPAFRRPAPRLGEHTREVLGELGISTSEIERLTSLGAVGVSD
jgi:crotonobetainyl-CoA:carnitine CoA-transferase CaiB-like acyl-CoA transferase